MQTRNNDASGRTSVLSTEQPGDRGARNQKLRVALLLLASLALAIIFESGLRSLPTAAAQTQQATGSPAVSVPASRGWLGVRLQSITPKLAAALQLARTDGALVTAIEPDSPAAAAGLKAGDIISAINGQSIKTAPDVAQMIASLAPDTSVSLFILRRGEEKTMSAQLGQLSQRQSEHPLAVTAQTDNFKTYMTANGGCRNVDMYEMWLGAPKYEVLQGRVDVDLFGTPILKWSDDDIEAALNDYRDCYLQIHGEQYLGGIKLFEQAFRGTIAAARDLDAQRKAQQQARVELLRRQAEDNKKAAAESNAIGQASNSELDEVTKEAEEARRIRQAAEEKLAETRAEISNKQRELETEVRQTEKLQRQAEIAKQGYEDITVEQFALDGKDLAARGAKVSLTGVYFHDENIDVLYDDQRAALMSRATGIDQAKVPLLMENASREFRQAILRCQSSPTTARAGCSMSVLGQASTCRLSNALGGEREVPCIAVEQGQLSDQR